VTRPGFCGTSPAEAGLRESAALALRWSCQYCSAESGAKPDCGRYHGFGQIAPGIGIGKPTGGHSDFLAAGLRGHARDGRFRRILLSGTVDDAMPALVYVAYAQENARRSL